MSESNRPGRWHCKLRALVGGGRTIGLAIVAGSAVGSSGEERPVLRIE
ncbi:MAG: hypothetical protein ACKVS9_04370 [Phycisphaerae bacterium]